MGRIADSAADLLAAGPRDARELGAALARAGVTRSRDPVAALRRAIRDDPRFMVLPDGRVAMTARAVDGRLWTCCGSRSPGTTRRIGTRPP